MLIIEFELDIEDFGEGRCFMLTFCMCESNKNEVGLNSFLLKSRFRHFFFFVCLTLRAKLATCTCFSVMFSGVGSSSA